jgi:hypothetical protein
MNTDIASKMKNLLIPYQKRLLKFAARFHDVKFAGQMLFMVIVLLISYSGVKSIQTNYELQKQISNLQQSVALQKLSNTNLQLENQYYNTDTYLELSARYHDGLGAPGEKEILVPQNVALGYTVALPKVAQQADKPSDKQPKSQQNFEAWVNFFLHRQNTSD